MAILRLAPGERVQIAGTYALVGHFGEATGIAPRWFDVGEHLPFQVVSDTAFGPLWYDRIADDHSAAQVA